MYNNGHEYLSCIKIPATKQATMKNTDRSEKVEPMDLAADYRNLISTANKVFGEGKWNHDVLSQSLDYVEVVGAKCHVGCVTHVKVQLENGNFHQDVGYCYAEESTKGLSVHNARIGSAVSALKRVLLSFGDKIDKELQQLEKQISSEQVNDVRTSVTRPLDKQIPEKSISNKVSSSEKQANDIQRNVSRSLDKQIPEKSSNYIVLSSYKESESDIQKGVIQSADEHISEKSSLSYLLESPFSLDNKVIVQPIKVGPKDNNIQRGVTQPLDKQISEKSILNKAPSNEEQANNVQRNVSRSSDKQIPEKFSICQVLSNKEQENNIQKGVMQSADEQISKKSNLLLLQRVVPLFLKDPSYSLSKVILQTIKVDPPKDSTTTLNTLKATRNKFPCAKIIEIFPNKETNSPTKQESNQALSAQEMQRLERKRKQMEKQMEFKKRMMEKGGLKEESTSDNKKPNPKY